MMRFVAAALFGLFAAAGAARAQDIDYGLSAQTADALPAGAIAGLAERTLEVYTGEGSLDDTMNWARLEIVAGRFMDAAATIRSIRAQLPVEQAARWAPYQVYAKAHARAADRGATFEDAYRDTFVEYGKGLEDLAAEEALINAIVAATRLTGLEHASILFFVPLRAAQGLFAYSFTSPVAGEPSNVFITGAVPPGIRGVASFHTHFVDSIPCGARVERDSSLAFGPFPAFAVGLDGGARRIRGATYAC